MILFEPNNREYDITMVHEYENIIKDLLAEDSLPTDISECVLNLHKDIFKQYGVPDVYDKIRLKRVEFENCYNFQTKNEVQFGMVENSLSGLIAPNRSGKTSFIETILFAVSGLHPRTSTEYEIINKNMESCACSCDLEIEGKLSTSNRIVTGAGMQSSGFIFPSNDLLIAVNFQLQNESYGKELVTASEEERKKILMTAFNIGAFSEIEKKITEMVLSTEAEIKVLTSKLMDDAHLKNIIDIESKKMSELVSNKKDILTEIDKAKKYVEFCSLEICEKTTKLDATTQSFNRVKKYVAIRDINKSIQFAEECYKCWNDSCGNPDQYVGLSTAVLSAPPEYRPTQYVQLNNMTMCGTPDVARLNNLLIERASIKSIEETLDQLKADILFMKSCDTIHKKVNHIPHLNLPIFDHAGFINSVYMQIDKDTTVAEDAIVGIDAIVNAGMTEILRIVGYKSNKYDTQFTKLSTELKKLEIRRENYSKYLLVKDEFIPKLKMNCDGCKNIYQLLSTVESKNVSDIMAEIESKQAEYNRLKGLQLAEDTKQKLKNQVSFSVIYWYGQLMKENKKLEEKFNTIIEEKVNQSKELQLKCDQKSNVEDEIRKLESATLSNNLASKNALLAIAYFNNLKEYSNLKEQIDCTTHFLNGMREAMKESKEVLNSATAYLDNIDTKLNESKLKLISTTMSISEQNNNKAALLCLNTKLSTISIYRSVVSKIPNKLLEAMRHTLSKEINNLIISMGEPFQIEISPSFEIKESTTMVSVNLLSGYQKFIVNLATRIAIWRLSKVAVLDALFIDEGFGACDEQNIKKLEISLRNIIKTEKNIPSLIFIVTHQNILLDKYLYIINGKIVSSKPELEAEVKPDADVEAKPELDVEVKPDADVEVKPDADVEVKPDAEVEIKPDAEAEVKPDAEAEIKPDAEAEVKPEVAAKFYCYSCGTYISIRQKSRHEQSVKHIKLLKTYLDSKK